MKIRRLICPEVKRIEIEEFELGPLPDDAVLVENEFTCVSAGTELYNWLHGGPPGRPHRFPHTTGYCNAGVVVDAGKNVKDFSTGDRVVGQGYHASHNILRKIYYKIPDNLPTSSAALLPLAAVAMHGLRVAGVQFGESVVVLGLGLVGQFSLSLARLAGASPLIAIDLNEFRLDKARARGADVCLHAGRKPDLASAVRECCEEDGANAVLECTGKPAVYPLAVRLVCTAGRLVAVGSPRGTVEFNFLDDVHLREVRILGAIQPSTPEQPHIYYWWTKDRDRRLLLRLMAQGRLPADDLITHVFRPEECQRVYSMLADPPRETLGVLFDWRG